MEFGQPPASREEFAELATELDVLLTSKKQNRILELCRFGRNHGFLDFSLRSKAYMMILGISEDDLENNQIALSTAEDDESNDVIVNDAKRSFLGYKQLSNVTHEDLASKRKELSQILHYFFKRHKSLSYYQGLNNFGELFILVFGKSLAYLIIEKYSLKYLRNYLKTEDFESEVKNQIYITLHILDKELPEYRQILGIWESGSNAQERLGFIVSWIVTWFSYKMKNLEAIFLNFDYIMCSPKHVISIMVSLVIRQLITKHNLKPGSEDEEIFSAFYSTDLDCINWPLVHKQATILEQTEDYGSLDYRKSDGKLSNLMQNWKMKLIGIRDTYRENREKKRINEKYLAESEEGAPMPKQKPGAEQSPGNQSLAQQLKSKGSNLLNKGLQFGRSFFQK